MAFLSVKPFIPTLIAAEMLRYQWTVLWRKASFFSGLERGETFPLKNMLAGGANRRLTVDYSSFAE